MSGSILWSTNRQRPRHKEKAGALTIEQHTDFERWFPACTAASHRHTRIVKHAGHAFVYIKVALVHKHQPRRKIRDKQCEWHTRTHTRAHKHREIHTYAVAHPASSNHHSLSHCKSDSTTHSCVCVCLCQQHRKLCSVNKPPLISLFFRLPLCPAGPRHTLIFSVKNRCCGKSWGITFVNVCSEEIQSKGVCVVCCVSGPGLRVSKLPVRLSLNRVHLLAAAAATAAVSSSYH